MHASSAGKEKSSGAGHGAERTHGCAPDFIHLRGHLQKEDLRVVRARQTSGLWLRLLYGIAYDDRKSGRAVWHGAFIAVIKAVKKITDISSKAWVERESNVRRPRIDNEARIGDARDRLTGEA